MRFELVPKFDASVARKNSRLAALFACRVVESGLENYLNSHLLPDKPLQKSRYSL